MASKIWRKSGNNRILLVAWVFGMGKRALRILAVLMSLLLLSAESGVMSFATGLMNGDWSFTSSGAAGNRGTSSDELATSSDAESEGMIQFAGEELPVEIVSSGATAEEALEGTEGAGDRAGFMARAYWKGSAVSAAEQEERKVLLSRLDMDMPLDRYEGYKEATQRWLDSRYADERETARSVSSLALFNLKLYADGKETELAEGETLSVRLVFQSEYFEDCGELIVGRYVSEGMHRLYELNLYHDAQGNVVADFVIDHGSKLEDAPESTESLLAQGGALRSQRDSKDRADRGLFGWLRGGEKREVATPDAAEAFTGEQTVQPDNAEKTEEDQLTEGLKEQSAEQAQETAVQEAQIEQTEESAATGGTVYRISDEGMDIGIAAVDMTYGDERYTRSYTDDFVSVKAYFTARARIPEEAVLSVRRILPETEVYQQRYAEAELFAQKLLSEEEKRPEAAPESVLPKLPDFVSQVEEKLGGTDKNGSAKRGSNTATAADAEAPRDEEGRLKDGIILNDISAPEEKNADNQKAESADTEDVSSEATAENNGNTATDHAEYKIAAYELFDISFVLPDGQEIEPQDGRVKVSVTFQNTDFTEQDRLVVSHHTEQGTEAPKLKEARTDNEGMVSADFVTESFSEFSMMALRAAAWQWIWATFDGTNGQIPHYNGAGKSTQNVQAGWNGTASVTLPLSIQAPTNTRLKLAGWYDITSGRYYKPGSTASIDKNTVFYADWVDQDYDIGQPQNVVGDSTDTSGFVTVSVFDYNDLFDVPDLLVTQRTTPDGKETWRFDPSKLNSAFLMADGHMDLGNLVKAENRPGNNGAYGNVQVAGTADNYPAPGIITPDLFERKRVKTLFPESTDNTVPGVHYVGDANYLFRYDNNQLSQNYGYYYYDSKKNAAAYNQSAGRFYVYNYTERTEYSDVNGNFANDFLPFNYPVNGERVYDGDGKGAAYQRANYWFGLKTNIDFFLPDDPGTSGGNKAVGGKDMIYRFSGDDDVWILVDGVMVLDLGGIHHTVYGEINFSTGVVTIKDHGDQIQETTLARLFQNAGGFRAGEHKLTMYYMERGASQSNMSLYFNIAPRYSAVIEKSDKDNPNTKLNGAVFSVYTDAACQVPAHLWNKEEEVGQNDKEVNTFTTGGDGTVRLYGLYPAHTYYLKEVSAPAAYPSVSDKVIILNLNQNGAASLGGEGATFSQLTQDYATKRLSLKVTNKKPIETEIRAEKKWFDADGMPLGNGIPDSVTVRLYRSVVTGGSSGGGGTSAPSRIPVNVSTMYFGTGNGANQDTVGLSMGDLKKSIAVTQGGNLTLRLTGIQGDNGSGTAGIYSVTANGKTIYPRWVASQSTENCWIGGRWGNYPYRDAEYVIEGITEATNVTVTLIGYLGYSGSTPLVSKTMKIDLTATEPTGQSGNVQPGTLPPVKPADAELVPNSERILRASADPSQNWKTLWNHLPVKDAWGRPYYYYVEEDTPEHYTTSYSGNATIGGNVTVNNVRDPQIEIPVQKKWELTEEAKYRNYQVEVRLYRKKGSGAEEDTGQRKNLNQNNGWKDKFTGLYQTEGGEALTYSVKEIKVIDRITGRDITKEYLSSVASDGTGGWIITNRRQLFPLTLTKNSTTDPNARLSGAVFSFYRDERCRDEDLVRLWLDQAMAGTQMTQFTTGNSGTDAGKVTVYGLEAGKTYYMKEITAPDGYYLLSSPMKFSVGADGVPSVDAAYAGNQNHLAISGVSGTIAGLTVSDNPIYTLPSSGGMGNYWFTISGAALLMSALLLFVYYRRKEELDAMDR